MLLRSWRLMFQPLLVSSHQTDLYVERAYSSQPHRNAPFCGHIFSRFSPPFHYYPFSIQCSALVRSFHPVHILIFTRSSTLILLLAFFIGHCLYSSLFSLLKIAFIRNTAIKLNGMFNVRQMLHLLVAVCSFSPAHRFSSCALCILVHLKMPGFVFVCVCVCVKRLNIFCVYKFKIGYSHL